MTNKEEENFVSIKKTLYIGSAHLIAADNNSENWFG
jgi:hypothetical protein